MRPASMSDAAEPSAITEVASTAGPLSPLFSLSDVKGYLELELSDSYSDPHLLALMTSAQAILEESTGLKFRPANGAEAEYVLEYPCRALVITESDVSSVTSVIEYSQDGTATTLDAGSYDVKRSAGRTYIVRTDDDEFECSYDTGMSAKIVFNRGVAEDSAEADLARAGLNYIVAELYDGKGTTSDRYQNNPAFLRVVRLLKSQKSFI